jgi:hypothetical protein
MVRGAWSRVEHAKWVDQLGAGGRSTVYKSIWALVKGVYRKEGHQGFMRGVRGFPPTI